MDANELERQLAAGPPQEYAIAQMLRNAATSIANNALLLQSLISGKEQPLPSRSEQVLTASHLQLRQMIKQLGGRTSFPGSTKTQLQKLILAHHAGEPLAPQFLRKQALVERRQSEYDALIKSVTLRQLALALPDRDWDHYNEKGWLKLDLRLSRKELRIMGMTHRVALSSMGVDPKRPETFVHAKTIAGCKHL